MNREDYQEVKKIFQSALDVAPDNLEDYLNEQCSGKTLIRLEVERLLNSYESSYLEKPAIENVAEAIIADKQWEGGQLIGHYKIVKKISKGGMGGEFWLIIKFRI